MIPNIRITLLNAAHMIPSRYFTGEYAVSGAERSEVSRSVRFAFVARRLRPGRSTGAAAFREVCVPVGVRPGRPAAFALIFVQASWRPLRCLQLLCAARINTGVSAQGVLGWA
jgi:hypothetical protein